MLKEQIDNLDKLCAGFVAMSYVESYGAYGILNETKDYLYGGIDNLGYHKVNDMVAKVLGLKKIRSKYRLNSHRWLAHYDTYRSHDGNIIVIAHPNCNVDEVFDAECNILNEGMELLFTSENSWYAPHSSVVILEIAK